ncbi:hypothetical protein Calab_0553 [Caldithrix abyssi DSM 13497]|uniref:Polysaccharide deacetylase n=1 Tax=Caldithrix abyssi DSM 13497 TaxID=880073 RepID=H1XRP3_CALAY|nr:hypothetical protein [Caldithrix abyssi]APF20135.1 Polysaccharide deacetylase [Caldithrix abyssi DSM 13497]EHO40196.1 hypothetical protein Calab_0553 [Caldithrix abyssi DSM 13497]
MDFTLKIFQNLLQTFIKNQFQFTTFHNYIRKLSNTKTANSTPQHLNTSTSISKPLNTSTSKLLNFSPSKLIILRHDVDRIPENALQTAIIEHELGIQGTYYFRVVPESYDLQIMDKIAELGHEIGYHYEDVDLAIKNYELRITNYELQKDELIDAAYESFCENLEMFRKNFDIKTICMHGSPRSKYDNKLIWSKYDYRELGIIGEPYFDIDFTEFAYYTDTGRRWDGNSVSVRDKVDSRQYAVGSRQNLVNSKEYGVGSKEGDKVTRNELRVTSGKWPRFRKTIEIIKAVEEEKFPQKAMITVHPQRWTDDPVLWVKELVWQNVKNIVKWGIVKVGSME